MLPMLKESLDYASTIAVIVAASLVGYKTIYPQRANTTPPIENIADIRLEKRDMAHVRGSANVVLVEFSDFECPFCGRYARTTEPEVKSRLVDRGAVEQVFFNFPLPIHAHAQVASEAAECAAAEGKFWEARDWLFNHQQSLAAEDLIRESEAMGLERRLFETCLRDNAQSGVISRHLAVGQKLHVSATPAFFVGLKQPDGSVLLTKRINGAVPFSDFQRAISQVSEKSR